MSPGRHISIGAIGSVVILASAGSASATTVSFASDDDSNFLTFNGTAGAGGAFQVRNGRTPSPTPVTLDVDDDNGPMPTQRLPVGLRVSLSATYLSSSPFESAWLHLYEVSGSYQFVHPTTGVTLLDVQVAGGSSRLSIVGSPTTWGSGGSITGSDAAAGNANGVNYSTGGALATYANSLGINLAPYGVGFGFSMEDFGFTMTNANADGGAIGLDAGHLPTTSWGSEASHSGHATPIPAPAAGALAGALGIGLAKRRRRK